MEILERTLARGARRDRRSRRDARRDRHHEPARDRSSSGSARRASRSHARSCGRTGARPSAAPSSRRAPTWIAERTGLVADPYFSATKIEWLLREHAIARALRAGRARRRARSTAGSSGSSPAARSTPPIRRTRRARCSSTSTRCAWSDELCELFGVPRAMLPEVRPSSGDFGVTRRRRSSARRFRSWASPAISRRRCSARDAWTRGTGKNTYGTGAFLLLNTGRRATARRETVCSRRSPATRAAGAAYALEASIFIAGAAVQWLRDGLGIIEQRERDRSARALDSSRPTACTSFPRSPGSVRRTGSRMRAARSSGSRAARRARTSRAPRSRRWRTAPPTCSSAMRERGRGRSSSRLRVDGGATTNDWLMQFQADCSASRSSGPTWSRRRRSAPPGLPGSRPVCGRSPDEFLRSRQFTPFAPADARRAEADHAGMASRGADGTARGPAIATDVGRVAHVAEASRRLHVLLDAHCARAGGVPALSVPRPGRFCPSSRRHASLWRCSSARRRGRRRWSTGARSRAAQGRRCSAGSREVGIDEPVARQRIYIAAITRCFPGPSPSGRGDRVPSPAQTELLVVARGGARDDSLRS